MEKPMNLQLKILTTKPESQTLTQFEKAFIQLFKTHPVLKNYTMVELTKGK